MEPAGAFVSAKFDSIADLVEDDGAARLGMAEDAERPNKRLRKDRCIWTTELHEKFELAIRMLGIDQAKPTTILKHMQEPSLTQANIKSKLQKYRVKMLLIARNQQEVLDGLMMLGSQADPHGAGADEAPNEAPVRPVFVHFRADGDMTMHTSHSAASDLISSSVGAPTQDAHLGARCAQAADARAPSTTPSAGNVAAPLPPGCPAVPPPPCYESWHAVDPTLPRAQRRNFTEEDKAVLEAAYEQQAYPSSKKRRELSEAVGCTHLQVTRWFQNRRPTPSWDETPPWPGSVADSMPLPAQACALNVGDGGDARSLPEVVGPQCGARGAPMGGEAAQQPSTAEAVAAATPGSTARVREVAVLKARAATWNPASPESAVTGAPMRAFKWKPAYAPERKHTKRPTSGALIPLIPIPIAPRAPPPAASTPAAPPAAQPASPGLACSAWVLPVAPAPAPTPAAAAPTSRGKGQGQGAEGTACGSGPREGV